MLPVEQPSTNDRLIVICEILDIEPQRVFACWTTPALLCSWWTAEAEIDARSGGAFRFSWPRIGRHLSGHFSRFEPGRLLAFPWDWEHWHYAVPKAVQISFEPLNETGTKLTVEHGPYTMSDEDREARQEHLDGWLHFLARLQEAA